jgi:hypothetical protein
VSAALQLEQASPARSAPSAVCASCGRRRPLKGMVRSRFTGAKFCPPTDHDCDRLHRERRAVAIIAWMLFVARRFGA